MAQRWVVAFAEEAAGQVELRGGKGAGLAEMTRLGLPVPPGFTVTTAACRSYLSAGGEPPAGLWDEVRAALAGLERQTGKRFGDPAAPLLLSVRSGAAVSMPGMMDTILNLGLNDETAAGLAGLTDERFALDSYRRLIQMFGKVALDVAGEAFEQALTAAKERAGVDHDHELSPAALRDLVATYKSIVADHGADFPEEPAAQLRLAVLAVFRSWDTERAAAYRRAHRIPDDLGTAANIQAMVFGNMGPDSATGVAFTRDPNSGAHRLFGEFLPNAQGEDVVAGTRTPLPLAQMADDPDWQPIYRQLQETAGRLERHYRDMQDIEFTVERGRLWLLQTRTGKRTAQAAVAIAVAQVAEGLIDRATAVRRVEPAQLEQLLHPRVDESQPLDVIATGLPASPGAVTGRVVFDEVEARERGEAGEEVILVRLETSADDFPGMERAMGILTARGGMTSHAAVVARGMGKPAVTGCAEIEIDEEAGLFRAGEVTVQADDEISLDGASGRVFWGRVETIQPNLGGGVETLLGWADDARRLGVRANADTPADAARARQLGAEGIGLCRTEHMFFGGARIDSVRQMILADDDDERDAALARLEEFQTADFAGLFRAMDGLPVVIRTLDPPLHEFLPHSPAEIARLARRLGREAGAVEMRIAALREANPMLGHRGCRLGLTFPGVTRMQARAIFRAALDCAAEGVRVEPEIMIPLVVDPEELRREREMVVEVAEELFAAAGRRVPYIIGSMIELPRAALLAAELAPHAAFFSFGTNDLTQTTYGLSRDDSGRFLPHYLEQGIFPADPFQVLDRAGVGRLIALAVKQGRRAQPGLVTGVCGEHGGDPASIAFCHEVGLDYVSCSPFRVPVARLAAAHAALADSPGQGGEEVVERLGEGGVGEDGVA